MRQIQLDLIDSTNKQAARLAQRGAPPPFAVFAEVEERASRPDSTHGPLPRGGLWCTVAWPLPRDNEQIAPATLVALSCVARAVEEESSRDGRISPHLAIKWPDRLFIDGYPAGAAFGRRLVLMDAASEASKRLLLLTIRCHVGPDTVADDPRRIRPLAGLKIELEALRARLLPLLSESIDTLVSKGLTSSRLREVHERLAYLNQRVVVHPDPKAPDHVRGIFSGIDPEGAAILETDRGRGRLRFGRMTPLE